MTAAASKTVERDRYNRRAQRFIEQAALADLDISGSEAIPIELRTPYIRFEEILLRHASPGRQVLDLCCGTGLHTLTAARAGADVTGIDIAELPRQSMP